MAWHQQTIRLRPRPRGFHLVTDEVVDALPDLAAVWTGLRRWQGISLGEHRADATSRTLVATVWGDERPIS